MNVPDGHNSHQSAPPLQTLLPSMETSCRSGFRFETEENEPLSPAARFLIQDFHILMVMGLQDPINISKFRAGLEATVAQHARFSSIRVMTSNPRWVRTVVNLDEHVIVPDLSPSVTSSVNPDELLEDYLASISTLPPMDSSRPLWEVHVLDLPTSEAAATLVFRIHHAVGDGMSLISLFVACAQSTSDQKPIKTLQQSSQPTHRKRLIASLPPRPARSAGALAFIMWLLSCALFAWNSMVDLAHLTATLLVGSDPHTVFTGVKGVEFRRKRFLSRNLSLLDIKLVKNAMGCTINDVLLGVASAALSRYYFRKPGNLASTKGGLCVKLALAVNMRPTHGIYKLDVLMDLHTPNNAKWGNRAGIMVLPLHITSHEDPLEYVRQAKKAMDRKKHSLAAAYTQKLLEMANKTIGVKVSFALFLRLVSHITVTTSNLIGPVEQLELFGNKVVYIAPTVYGHPSALTIHWQSYMDTIRVVLAVDDEQFPDSHQLLGDFAEALLIIRNSLEKKNN